MESEMLWKTPRHVHIHPHPSLRPKRVSDATQDARKASPPTSTLVWDGQRGIRGSAREKPSAARRAFFVGARVALLYVKRDAFVVAGNSAECSLIRNSFALTLICLDISHPRQFHLPITHFASDMWIIMRWMKAVMHLMLWHVWDYVIDVSSYLFWPDWVCSENCKKHIIEIKGCAKIIIASDLV